MLWLRTKTGDRPSLSQMDTTRKTSLRWSESCCCHLVGGWALPLWRIMEWVRQLGWWHSIPNIWTVIKKCSSHHQPEYHIISITSWWAPMCPKLRGATNLASHIQKIIIFPIKIVIVSQCSQAAFRHAMYIMYIMFLSSWLRTGFPDHGWWPSQYIW